jgi:hypothetical protein
MFSYSDTIWYRGKNGDDPLYIYQANNAILDI